MRIDIPFLKGGGSVSGSFTITGSLQVSEGIVGTASSASFVEFEDIGNKPSLVSGSSQIDLEDTTGFSDFSSSVATTFSGLSSDFGDLENKPTLVSGSSQIELNQISGNEFISQSYAFPSNLTIRGNLVVSGSTFIEDTQTIQITDNLLVVNSGEQGEGVTSTIAGIQIDRGSATDFQFIFDENSKDFQVGEIGDLQSVATRQTEPTNAGIPFWNSSQKRFDNSSNATLNSSGILTAVGFTGPLTGNAATATTLATARTIGGVSFNGSANIDLPGVNTAGTQNTSGNAATATTATNCSRSVVAGNGLTGGGALTANRTLTVGAGSGISVAASSVAVDSTVIRTTGNQSMSGTKTFTGQIRLSNTASLRQSSSTWTGNAGSGEGKLEYHSNRWYINAGSDSTEVVRFRRGSSDIGIISNAGALTMSNNITAFSDVRIKDNIKTIDNALNKVKSLRGVSFTRTDQEDKDKKYIGVIAQEIFDVIPEVVEGSEETQYSVAYGNITAVLIEAIKEQQTAIDTLVRKLETLESQFKI